MEHRTTEAARELAPDERDRNGLKLTISQSLATATAALSNCDRGDVQRDDALLSVRSEILSLWTLARDLGAWDEIEPYKDAVAELILAYLRVCSHEEEGAALASEVGTDSSTSLRSRQ